MIDCFEMFKILFNVRENYLYEPGGDTIQILRTAAELKKLGVDIDLSNSLHPELDNIDLVHLFNLTRVKETLIQCENAKKHNTPIALSTIYWNTDEFTRRGIHRPLYRLAHRIIRNDAIKLKFKKTASRIYKKNLKSPENLNTNMGFKAQQKYILDCSDILLPNSEMEMDQIKKDLLAEKKYVVVPNAADLYFQSTNPSLFLKKYGANGLKQDNFVLCVCRIEDRKNILHLIKAVNPTDLKLVIIGNPNPSQLNYYKKCRKSAGRNILFLNHMEHEELGSAYAAAKTHVMPSWYETPGLSSLEAGLAGCNIVTTDRGSTREYFEDLVDYCSPESIASIRQAILNSFKKPKTQHLIQKISKEYTWKKSGEQTLKAYKQVLES